MFTIIIPTHDRPLLLRRTLKSLIAQTWREFAVIVVSDSSTYLPPYAELSELQSRYTYIVRSGTSGPGESRNLGLALAQSRYVMFLDDDDTLEPGHLEAVARQIGDGSPELLYCDFKVCHEDRTTEPPSVESIEPVSISGVTADSVYVLNRVPNSCIVYRRDVVADVRHDTGLRLYEDWDFLLACLRGRTLVHMPVDSVTIHKSRACAPENMRRGNSRDDLIGATMLELYRRHPAPSMAIRLERLALMASAGLSLDLDSF
ncbi:Glycosyltransferase involved in cell wall bisynthesis [Burkholderia sp. WP9]|uniref:glycosyltransferase family 2 protein n=1 Tax=Burkholderia sp. WP9 TaxID=1500263 RepID=UPI000895C3E1|nr:glycosyltransferase family 2 protein [Burkholderia sp. WP9]SEF10993.1 Glycosyltransferase involved in cell wall bisynthesis [Burkholderia sp. WP9]